jgi:serine phosphatase RsbU (regulator of sigma subunit)
MDVPTFEVPPLDSSPVLGWMREAWEFSPVAVAVTFGPQHLLVYQNGASRALFGERSRGVPLEQAFPGTTTPPAELDEALATGEVVVRERCQAGVRGLDGGEVPLRFVIAPYGPDGEPPVGLVVMTVDLSAQARAELTSNRTALLARLTERMATAQDPNAALQALTDVLVPDLADVAAVYVQPDLDRREPHRDRPAMPDALSLSPAFPALGPPPTTASARERSGPWEALFASGRPVLIRSDDRTADQMTPDPAVRAWLGAAGARDMAVIPLGMAGRLVGSVLLVLIGDREGYSEAILPFLTDLAARAGVAVAQLRRHRHLAEVSHRLQQALLPDAPPYVCGLQVAARYLAGAPEVEVGGDWWEVVQLDDRYVAIGVGDVSGRGVEAAIVMGQARAAMRTASLAGLSPGQVLALLDRQMCDLVTAPSGAPGEAPHFATALHAVLDLVTGLTRLASAGHPPPLVHDGCSGSRAVVVTPGPPIGIGLGGYAECTVHVPPGGSLLMFTDGLVEDRTRDLDLGLAELAAQLTAFAGCDVEHALDKILAARRAVGPQGRAAADDVAVVLVRREGGALPR